VELLKATVFFLLCAAVVAPFIAPAGGVDNNGAETITIFGGNRGDVNFPHRQHQGRLAGCKPCHELFPKTSGSIDALKSEGKLSNKQVMNTLCVDCHRTKRDAGEKSGPVSCNACHTK
jgi:hypothetical protein